jgi:glutathione synthase/RimK-type ligase-like ATP-grasp enzyme
MSVDCMFVTCEHVPELDPDDRLLLQELCERGLRAAIGVWSDASVDWSEARLCLLRSTWDYHSRYNEFLEWVGRVGRVTTIRNDPHLLRWNADKSYLSDLERRGVPVVPTVWVRRNEGGRLAEIIEASGWCEVVIKPAQGAASHDVMHVRPGTAQVRAGQRHLDRLALQQDVLIQPYLGAVATYGERALIFFGGRYSHAVVKKPFDSVLVVSNARSARVDPATEEIAVATKAVQSVPSEPLYARVDLLRDDDGSVLVSEVELIEPGLYMAVHDPAVGIFADAIEDELAVGIRA